MRSVEIILFLVVLATVVAVVAKRLSVPAPSLLVVAGALVGLVPWVPEIQVSPDVVALVVLPPLLYAAGEDLSWRDLRAVWRPVAILAFGLVMASAAAVAAVAAAVTPLSAQMAFVLGAILASTDPVAVTALGRRLPLPVRAQTLIQAESLFNDATSLVLVRVATAAVVAGTALDWKSATADFLILAGGGAAIGAAVAGAVALVRHRTEDPVLETVVALVTPYAAYVLAESLEVSGVTAVVVASVILGGLSPRLTNAQIRLQLHAVYGTVVFLLESVVFSLVGLALPTLIEQLTGSVPSLLAQAAAITATLLLVRLLWMLPLSAAMHAGAEPGSRWRLPLVVTWAGTRGVLPLAAALSIPLITNSGAPLPQRDLVLTLTAVVIVLTLTVQGFSLAPLVHRTGVAVTPDRQRSEGANARLHMARAALNRLNELDDLEAVPAFVSLRLRRSLTSRLEEGGDGSGGEEPGEPTYRSVRRELIAIESAELTRLYESGIITERTRRRLQRTLDLQDASLEEP